MRSRMDSYQAGSRVHINRVFLIYLIVISAVSCATRDMQESVTGLNNTVSGRNMAADGDTATGKNNENNPGINELSDAEFAGTYKLSGDPICSITLVINRDQAGFLYTFYGSITGSGRIGLEKKEGQVHVYFNRAGCTAENDSVTGVYFPGIILIRKDADVKGNNSCFRDCDSKNLRFVKN